MNAELQQALAGGRTLITPNQRAARSIQRAFADCQAEPLWSPATILPLDAWLTGLWNQRLLEGRETRVLLNRSQQQVLWREIIAAETEPSTLRSPDALAEMAARAWNLLCLYQGKPRLRESSVTLDTQAFERWSRSFDSRLRNGQWITSPELPSALAAAADLGELHVALVDFDVLTPALAGLFDRIPHDVLQSSVEPLSASLVHAEDDQAELEAAARWVLEQRAVDPHARISIVVPNLEDRRAAIERSFAPILSPGRLPITAGPDAEPDGAPAFEFSLGRALGELPMALAAVDLLKWPLKPLPIERVSALLLSPWLGTADDRVAEFDLATFDAFELRRLSLLRPELSLEATLRLLERSPRTGLGDLHKALNSLHRAARAVPATQAHAAWADAFRLQLDAVGWSHRVRADSPGFQQHRRWESALDELATLDFEGARPNADEALDALLRILRQTVFAPESQEAPVQILGPLELGGIASDALWFLGADDLAWPAPLSANPLLPWSLQRALGMPGADRGRDDAQAQALTGRIAHAARTIVFSYGRRSEEGERRPSPLLASLALEPLSIAHEIPAPARESFELVLDVTAVSRLPDLPVRGGAQVLKLQAACAFRAFAERRLWSTQPDAQQPGLDALERGNIVHAVMQQFWNEVADQDTLRKIGEAGWHAALDRAIAHSFHRMRPETRWDEAYLKVQQQRLRDLLLPWIELESARIGSFEVEKTEEGKPYTFGPLRLSLRYDRIDTTAQGDLILDYKTGLATPSMWQGERPDEPQIPLYAVLAKQEGRRLAGTVFAQLRPGDGLGLQGYADDTSVFGKTAVMQGATLEDQIEAWRVILLRLAEAFAAGDSRVLPKLYPKTCERCAQRILCRLNPEALGDEPEEELEGEPTYG